MIIHFTRYTPSSLRNELQTHSPHASCIWYLRYLRAGIVDVDESSYANKNKEIHGIHFHIYQLTETKSLTFFLSEYCAQFYSAYLLFVFVLLLYTYLKSHQHRNICIYVYLHVAWKVPLWIIRYSICNRQQSECTFLCVFISRFLYDYVDFVVYATNKNLDDRQQLVLFGLVETSIEPAK